MLIWVYIRYSGLILYIDIINDSSDRTCVRMRVPVGASTGRNADIVTFIV